MFVHNSTPVTQYPFIHVCKFMCVLIYVCACVFFLLQTEARSRRTGHQEKTRGGGETAQSGCRGGGAAEANCRGTHSTGVHCMFGVCLCLMLNFSVMCFV